MYYAQVYLRNLKGLFTWHSDTPVSVGDRVLVSFRNRSRAGIVLQVSKTKPDFETQPILEIWDEKFLDKNYINLAFQIAEDCFAARKKFCPS